MTLTYSRSGLAYPYFPFLYLIRQPCLRPLVYFPAPVVFSYPSPDPPFPLSPFIGVYLSPYILTFILSIYKPHTLSCSLEFESRIRYSSICTTHYALNPSCSPVSPYLFPWVLHLLLASPELAQGAKAMSVPDSTLEPLGQFLASGDSSWLRKCSTNSGLLSHAPDFVCMLRD